MVLNLVFKYEDNRDFSPEFYDSIMWQEIREEILERDDFCCRVCHSEKNLECHHIIPRRYYYLVNFDIDSFENLIILCSRCHELADRIIGE